MNHTDVPLRLALLMDPLGEERPGMDSVGEALHEQFHGPLAHSVWATSVRPRLVPLARRMPGLRERPRALDVDRMLTRFLAYPARAALRNRGQDAYHVVDHAYAQLVHTLPPERTGVYCHGLEALSALLESERAPQRAWRRALAWATLKGLQRAAVVFYPTRAVREALLRHGLVAEERLVYAPPGVSPEFGPEPAPGDTSPEVLRPLEGRPYLLHVGRGLPGSREDALLELFAALRRQHPDLCLVQRGTASGEAPRAQEARLGRERVLVLPPRLDRATLAGLYRRARAVMVTSEAEGLGLSVLKAMACGTPVVAGDLPVLRELGGDTITYAAPGDSAAWTQGVRHVLESQEPPASRDRRIARGRGYSWSRHARTLLDTYRRLTGIPGAPASQA